MTDSGRKRDAHEQSESETGIHGSPNADAAAPGQSSASDWDMDKTKPSGDSRRKPESTDAVKKATAQQAPQDGNR
jgi:hypothetical protein